MAKLQEQFVLLDANILINAFDSRETSDPVKVADAKQIVRSLMSSESTKIAITPLIRYEVLRGVRKISFDDMKSILDDFHEFEIVNSDGEFAAKIFKAGKYNDRPNIDKHNFDIFHYSVARNYQLEWKSLDKDFKNIDTLVKQAKKDNVL